MANMGECRCSQQRMCWLYEISAGLVIFENYLKKKLVSRKDTMKKKDVIFQYHNFVFVSDVLSLLVLLYL